MKTKTIFFILTSILVLDIITTYIGLKLPNSYEYNPIARELFKFGVMGWITAFMVQTTFIAFFSYIVGNAQEMIEISAKLNRKKKSRFKLKDPSGTGWFVSYGAFIVLFVLQISTVINNLIVISWHTSLF